MLTVISEFANKWKTILVFVATVAAFTITPIIQGGTKVQRFINAVSMNTRNLGLQAAELKTKATLDDIRGVKESVESMHSDIRWIMRHLAKKG